MPDATDIARRKIVALKKQIADLEAFIVRYEDLMREALELARSENVPPHADPLVDVGGNETTPPSVDKSVDIPVENTVRPGRPRGKTGRPDEIALHMERIIREAGRPMTRGEIVKAFEVRDLKIPYDDKGRYVGTIAWRHKGTFVNIPGQGYWLRDEPRPGADREFFDASTEE